MEIFNLWESNIAGLMLSTNDFIILAEDGISILCIFETMNKRIVEDKDHQRWIVHPLQSCNYLKIADSNLILIKEQSKNNERSISIQEQVVQGGETFFNNIYKIKIKNMTLIELLLF